MMEKRQPASRFVATCVAMLALARIPAVHGSDTPASLACRMNAAEHRLATLLTEDPQKRSRLECDPELQEFARQRARDMAERGYLSHLTPERKGPNQLLRERGFPLPPSYPGGLSNNIESITGGIRSAREVWRVLTASSTHRSHLLGQDPEFLEQDLYGVAYHQDLYSPHVDYWVIVIARRARAGEPRLLCTPEPAECFRTSDTSPGSRSPESH
jgi:hypothetical protein